MEYLIWCVINLYRGKSPSNLIYASISCNITTLGYSYIIDGIAMALEDDTLLKDFQNGLYKILAKKYNLPRNFILLVIQITYGIFLPFLTNNAIISYTLIPCESKSNIKRFSKWII